MKLRFYIIEDDPAARRMLERILQESDVGTVIGQAADGAHVHFEDLEGADVILIDLLMPGRDGIETIRELKEQGFRGRFIMISQVENKDMVADAYQNGIDTFIHKPINRLEVLSVIRRVAEHVTLEHSLATIKRTLTLIDDHGTHSYEREKSIEQTAAPILSQLGIAGESGARDLLQIMQVLDTLSANKRVTSSTIPLKDLYVEVLLRTHGELDEARLQREVRAMEQRIRRTVLQALGHLASLGLTDYTNPIFEHYAPRLFDFQEVRQRMQEIEEGEKNTRCRIQIRKFLFALFEEVQTAKRGR
ncbi:transcriptional regulatory protein GlnL [Collibacillus ludicampi]|uniref:Transcriptional regulatory protein GlnL n=1 Tax=Collibacillus ludicampi TaxID=2771369 RepID=A0AAV4LF72_9BACL|nr:response regulator [Collibacillus ludicampi]GIM46456.1 transcriptional regulatory protein GlnL [Collibacillus ludicampi]